MDKPIAIGDLVKVVNPARPEIGSIGRVRWEGVRGDWWVGFPDRKQAPLSGWYTAQEVERVDENGGQA